MLCGKVDQVNCNRNFIKLFKILILCLVTNMQTSSNNLAFQRNRNPALGTQCLFSKYMFEECIN